MGKSKNQPRTAKTKKPKPSRLDKKKLKLKDISVPPVAIAPIAPFIIAGY